MFNVCAKTNALVLAGLLSACTTSSFPNASINGHLQSENLEKKPTEIEALFSPALPPAPKLPPAAKEETYSVLVNRVKVHDLLFSLARDAKLNIDIHADIVGFVTINAINQTLLQLLKRISRQVDLRFEFDGDNLIIFPDSPFLKHYQIDYVNMTREVSGTVATNTQISTSGLSSGTTQNSTGSNNISRIEIKNTSKNQFWLSLEKNIKDLLHETDKLFPEGSSETITEQESTQITLGSAGNNNPRTNKKASKSQQNAALLSADTGETARQNTGNAIIRHSTFREAAAVITNAETGVMSVRATGRQHEKIQEFIERVTTNARRQVLIETTIVEVQLTDAYQQGVDWARLRGDGSGFSLTQPSLGANISSSVTPFIFRYKNNNPLNLAATVSLMQSFGRTKVLSSPKLSVLNNQTATLKVSEEFVYFLVKTDIVAGNANTDSITAVTTTPQSVSVGLFMSVTPQISDNGVITLNIRPSISSISELKQDPNPSIPAGIKNLVPQIRTREIESVMRVESGDIAVLGGLMEDRLDNQDGRVPILGAIPFFGEIFNNRSNTTKKSELIIFLRPTIITESSIRGDFSSFREALPDQKFYAKDRLYEPFSSSENN